LLGWAYAWVKKLYLGSPRVEVTATAAQLNRTAVTTAGTAEASKVLVLGTNRNVDVLAVADLKIGSGAGTSVTSTAAEINALHSSGVTNADLVKLHTMTATATEVNRAVKKANGALAAVDTAGGLFSWANPETGDILVVHVALVSTHVSTGACTVDVGTTAATATTLSDNLIDGKDVNAATGTFTNMESAGTNGKAGQRLATAKWVTGSVASGASAGIVGTYEIYYIVL